MSSLAATRPPPAFRVKRLPEWRVEGPKGELLVKDDEAGIEQRWNPWTRIVLEGLAEGRDFDGIVEKGLPNWPERDREYVANVVRRLFYTLHRMKVIELLLEVPKEFDGGRYENLKELGRGGVGIAYLARDRERDEKVVVKRPWDYFAPMATTDGMMRSEAAVMERLDHAGIARARATFEQDGLFHLVRDFVPGQELSIYRASGIVDRDTRHRVAREIAGIVGHLHERGYLLLDLRPANFFVEPATMSPMLIDVGHCKEHRGGEIEVGKKYGSPGFADPSVTELGRASLRSDVWGFGRLYFFLATGRLPRHEEKLPDLLARMTGEDDRRIVAACAADAPGDRLPDMRAAAALFG